MARQKKTDVTIGLRFNEQKYYIGNVHECLDTFIVKATSKRQAITKIYHKLQELYPYDDNPYYRYLRVEVDDVRLLESEMIDDVCVL